MTVLRWSEAISDDMDNTNVKHQLLVPGPHAIDITPMKDGGVLKEVQECGQGADRPLIGDRVSISYEAMFSDGSHFDSSHFQGDVKFEFNVGKGSVIKAWDLAVATMSAGEKSRFYCCDNYVYTDEVDNSRQSSNGYIIYDIHLFHWQGVDVSKKKDGGIRKSILVKGEGRETPNDGATCEVHITGFCNDRIFENRDAVFVMGEGSEKGIVSGIEIAARKFHKGEKARLKVDSRYAYGSEGCELYDIPPDCQLVYEVHMKNFVRVKDFWEMDSTELLSNAERFKQHGTEFFQAGKYDLARHYYKKIVQFLASEAFAEDMSEAVNKLLLAAHLNLAMCYLKLLKHRQAKDSCDSALALDADNIKGHYRRGLANLGLQCLDAAFDDFTSVLKLDPGNKPAQQQLSLTVKQQADSKAQERSMFSGMFDKFAKQDLLRDGDYGRNDADVFSSIGEWSNEMASGMMTLEQEMAAFGEKMPEPKYRHCGKENERPDSDDDDDD